MTPLGIDLIDADDGGRAGATTRLVLASFSWCDYSLSAQQPATSFVTPSTTRSAMAAWAIRAVTRATPWRGSRPTSWSTTSNGTVNLSDRGCDRRRFGRRAPNYAATVTPVTSAQT